MLRHNGAVSSEGVMEQALTADERRHVREVLERKAKAVTLRPAVGQNTARTSVRLRPGLACEVEEGRWTFVAGMSDKAGGTNAGPNPGVLGRAALGTCLALGYAMWAARLDVPIDDLSVEVEADYDARGELGVSDEVPPGYLQVRYHVRIASPASPERLERLIDTADRYSPYRDVFARAHDVRRQVTIESSSASPARSSS
jgi:uncharacterized OsmC-like protein